MFPSQQRKGTSQTVGRKELLIKIEHLRVVQKRNTTASVLTPVFGSCGPKPEESQGSDEKWRTDGASVLKRET